MNKVFNVVLLTAVAFVLLFTASLPREEKASATQKHEPYVAKEQEQEKEKEKETETGYGVRELKNIEELVNTIESKKVAIFYFYGDTCPHCHKFNPILDKVVQKHQLTVYSFNTFNEENGIALQQFTESGTYQFPPVEYVPMIVVMQNQQLMWIFGANQWAVQNPDAELGYDINEQLVDEFFGQDFNQKITR